MTTTTTTSTITAACFVCDHEHRFSQQHRGKMAKCRKCGSVFPIEQVVRRPEVQTVRVQGPSFVTDTHAVKREYRRKSQAGASRWLIMFGILAWAGLMAIACISADYQSGGHALAGWLIITPLPIIYFLPYIVAALRDHKQMQAIAALNVLLGWTMLGWIVSLVWSFTDPE